MSGRILIVDDAAGSRIVLGARLAAACYDTFMAANGTECLVLAQGGVEARPDLILLGLDLRDMTAAALLRRLRADPRSRAIPAIGLDGGHGSGARIAALAAGADDVFAASAPDALLLARIRNLLRSRVEPATPPELAEPAAVFEPAGAIALVSSGPGQGGRLRANLRRHLRDRLAVLSRAEAMDAALAGAMDVFVVDAAAGENAATALRLVSDLKSRQATRHAAVCVTGSGLPDEVAATAYDLGADDVVGAPVEASELAVRLRGLLRRKHSRDHQRVRLADGLRLALVDPLTGLYNRRHAVPELREIAARAGQAGTGFSVLVVDLDRFKAVNDRHGHAVGDAVLVEVAQRLRLNLRDGDLLARIGGEEFLIALPGVLAEEARPLAERLCAAIMEAPIQTASGLGLRVTVSIGVAGTCPDALGHAAIDAVVEAADLALLDAKSAGRNQVTIRPCTARS